MEWKENTINYNQLINETKFILYLPHFITEQI